MKYLIKYNKYVAGLILLMIASVLPAQEVLDDYLEKAAMNNPGLKARFSEYMAALEVIPQVKSLPDPQIAFGYFIQPVQTRTGPQVARLSASQMFPWFGTLKAREDVAIQKAKVKYEVFEEARSDLFNQVRSTYYNIYFNKQAVSITQENIEILNSFRQIAIVKVEAGLVSAVDEYRIEIESGDLQNQLALLLDQQFVLEIMFSKLLNIKEDEPIIITDSLRINDFQLSKNAALDSVMLNNNILQSLAFQAESFKQKRNEVGKAGMPSFNLGLDYTFTGTGENNLSGDDAFMFPKLGITIPIYRKKYRAMVQETVYLEEGKLNEKENTENTLRTVFENGWSNYSDAGRRIYLYEDQLILAFKAMKLLETEYATGNGDFEEILRMERKVLKYNLELEKAKADKLAAISFIKYLMGK